MKKFDIVLLGGRVLDPESGRDELCNVGILGRSISAISSQDLRGEVELDVAGLVVTPGFIDLNSHGQTTENYCCQAMDGVTTALELEFGAAPVREWYAAREGRTLINFGASAGHIPARMAVMGDTGTYLPRDAAMSRSATEEERSSILAEVRRGLGEGALGIGFGLAYTPTATHGEILELFHLAGTRGRPIFVHMRYGVSRIFEALQEVIANSAVAGAPVHVMHINSMAQKRSSEALRLIEGARRHGVDVTTDAYPYIAGASSLESSLFDAGWQEALGADYSDLMWVETGERLTAQTFEQRRSEGGRVVIFGNTEENLRAAITHSLVMIASDGRILDGKGHPRSAGTYARVLGKYVREEKIMSLMEAVRKCSLMPARRLEVVSAQMRKKGRLRVGADADIAVFDATRVVDRADFENPTRFSDGVCYVLVNGELVVRDGVLQEGKAPGIGVRAGGRAE